jgi:23S rRNA pseudouridine2605 synthase
MRLNRYLSNSGVASRRKADFLIQKGLVKVNDKITTFIGYKVLSTDSIKLYGRFLYIEKKVYILLNKPKGVLSTTKDELNRKTVINIVSLPYRLYPIGRLDSQTIGVILLTNDGHFCHKMTNSSTKVKKIYHLILNRKFKDFKKMREGINLDEGIAKINSIYYIKNSKKNEISIEIYIGWNRIVRRIFRALDYKIIKLERISFAGITNNNLKIGKWRILTDSEVNNIKNYLNK